MRNSLLYFFLIVAQLTHAQNTDSVKISGQILPDSGLAFIPDKADVKLVPYNEGESIITTQVSNDGSFIFKVAVNRVGVYDLKYKSFKMNLLLTDAEPVYRVIIKSDGKQEVKSMKISGSRENDAYRIFKRENMAFKDALRDIKSDCADNEKNCLAKFRKHCASQNELMEYLKTAYKGTFTARVLAGMAEVPSLTGTSPALSQLQAGFFDDADLTDTTLYRSPDLNNKLSSYLDHVADTSAAARIQFIRHLMDKTRGKKSAQKGLLTVLFNNFLDDYREPYIQSLVQWANSESGLSDNQPVLAAKMKLVAHVLPGLPAPDVTGDNLQQQPLSLLNTVKANRLTLLIFWESDCPHCRKAMPEFIRLYKQYHPKGLEVFAASLDTDKDKWKLFIDYNHLTWTNIVLPEKSSAHADYFIQYTPTAVLIDSAGHIIRRFIAVDNLEKDIAAVLGKAGN